MVTRLTVLSNHLNKNSLLKNNCSLKTIVHDKEYKYTCNGFHFTNQQRKFYEENGYMVIKNLISDSIINACRDHFVNICNGVIPAGNMFLMEEPSLKKAGYRGEHLYYKIQDILYDDVFKQYTSCPELLDCVQCFTGPNITAIHSMLINKPPDAGGTDIHPLHQDLLYFPFRPEDLIVGTWTAMETIDSDNGCLVVIPGSHKAGQLYSHKTKPNQEGSYKTFYGVSNARNEEPIPLHMHKGDTVFLHPLLVHGSGSNRSKRFRKAISCHYAASECNVINTKGSVQDEVAKDVEATVSKTHGVSSDFGTIMTYRCAVVRGSEGFTAM